jgi:GTP-binding protein EngB required for normal cell division
MTIAGQTVECHPIEESLRKLLAVEVAGSGSKGLRDKLLFLEEKLASDEFRLAVLGQMKRGKSSFINALLGADVLPTGVLPVTAIITEVRYASAPNAVIVYAAGDLREEVSISTLADYITEAGNPGNGKQVASVEIAYPSPFLERGIILIDTPGIGSTHLHNTQTTERYLERVDAGIVVFSIDPPITEIESQFLKSLRDEIPKLFFVLNKTDIASSVETQEIALFLEAELERLQIASPEIFPLSARRGLQEKRQASTELVSSGLEIFERRLQAFFLEEKREVLVRSVAMDALQIARTLRFAASVGIRAERMSTEELKRKRLALDQLLEQIEVELRDLQVLLRQHSANILALVERDLKERVEASVPEVQQHLELFHEEHPKDTGRSYGALLEDFLMREVQMIFRKWRVQEDERIQTQLDALSTRFVDQAKGILERLEMVAGTLFDVPVEHLAISCPLKMESHVQYRVERVFYSLDSFLLLLPRFLLRPVVLRRMRGNVSFLLDMNAGRIRFDYLERLQSSMVQFERNLCAAVTMVAESLTCAVRTPEDIGPQNAAALEVLDTVIRDCSQRR